MTEHEQPDPAAEQEPKKTTPRFQSLLPYARAAPDRSAEDLDLDVDGIETRLPFGSEDIADK